MINQEETISELNNNLLIEEIQNIKEQQHLIIKILGELDLKNLNARSKKNLQVIYKKLKKIDSKIYESKRKKETDET